MKHKNPYSNIVLVWAIALTLSILGCVLGIVRNNVWQSVFELALAVIDGIFLGYAICRYKFHKEMINSINKFEEGLKHILELQEKELFKEFEDEEKEN